MKMSKEIVDARRKLIMQRIQTHGSVDVNTLANELKVTPLTIRRDLQYWEDLGAIQKYYGGARLIQSFVDDNDENNNEAHKHAIAKYAANFVEEGDTIFINTSSTALLMIKYITNKRVTVITNNAKAIFLDHDPNLQIVLTGGELRIPKESMVGDFTLATLHKVTANKSFLGCSGFEMNTGMTTAILSEVAVNVTMIERTAGPTFLLADATKINHPHQFTVAPCTAFNYLITDERTIDEELQDFKLCGVTTQKVSPYYNFKKDDEYYIHRHKQSNKNN